MARSSKNSTTVVAEEVVAEEATADQVEDQTPATPATVTVAPAAPARKKPFWGMNCLTAEARKYWETPDRFGGKPSDFCRLNRDVSAVAFYLQRPLEMDELRLIVHTDGPVTKSDVTKRDFQPWTSVMIGQPRRFPEFTGGRRFTQEHLEIIAERVTYEKDVLCGEMRRLGPSIKVPGQEKILTAEGAFWSSEADDKGHDRYQPNLDSPIGRLRIRLSGDSNYLKDCLPTADVQMVIDRLGQKIANERKAQEEARLLEVSLREEERARREAALKEIDSGIDNLLGGLDLPPARSRKKAHFSGR